MAATPPLYWAPDKDPSWLVNPGVLTEVSNMVPRTRGTLQNYACTPGEQLMRLTPYALDATPMSAAIIQTASAIPSTPRARLIVGGNFADSLLEAGGTQSLGADVFTNISRTGNFYDAREWQFAGFGNAVICVPSKPHQRNRPEEFPQYSSGAGVRAVNLPGCTIKACAMTVQKGFIVLGNVSDTTPVPPLGGDPGDPDGTWYGDGWACSGLNNTASWVANLNASANLATGANWGRLLDAPGQIRALVNLRDGIVAYKPDAMLMGRYTGNPFTWSWSLISDGVGSTSGNNVAVVNGMHYFLHRSGVYMFDGSLPRNIGEGKVNEFLSRKLQSGTTIGFALGPKAVVDDRRNLIYWFLATNEAAKATSAYIDAAFVLNYVTGACGWIDDPWERVFPLPSFGRGFGCPVMATHEDMVLWNEAVVFEQNQNILTAGNMGGAVSLRMPVVGTSALTTSPPASSLPPYTYCSVATGDLGDEENYTLLRGVKPRLIIADRDAQGGGCQVDGKASQADYFDDEGVLIDAVATTTGTGHVLYELAASMSGAGKGMRPHTFAADDYLAFDYKRSVGAQLKVTVRLTTTTAANCDFSQTVSTGINVWTTARMSASAFAGLVINKVSVLIEDPTVAGPLYRYFIRNIRITDPSGVPRRRLWNASEERVTETVAMLPVRSGAFVGASSYASVNGYKSVGVPFTYDQTRRRFQGAVSNRYHRARITFVNQTELAALDIDMTDAGKE